MRARLDAATADCDRIAAERDRIADEKAALIAEFDDRGALRERAAGAAQTSAAVVAAAQ
ncbi:hypothetical protein [Methylosinus sp. PW1]|uniref:hypothetical protein n=1 Tax=Methylosinus sp. PW1 TaxID=107636 RepID=UPI000A554C42|nr:hypothetical protein [Methylosinus sp. PW1]